MDAKFILNYIRDTCKYTTLETVETLPTSFKEALMHLSQNGETFAYYAKEFTNITDKPVSFSNTDVLVGFVAKENTTITIQCGPINIVKNLAAGEFMYALPGKIAPLLAIAYAEYAILNLTGTVYTVHGILDTPRRKIVAHACTEQLYLYNGCYAQNGMITNPKIASIAVLNNICDICKYTTLPTVETLPLTEIEAIRNVVHTGNTSYYANKFTNFTGNHICNTGNNVIIGFVAKENTSMTIQYGPINIVKNLVAGEFMYALHENVVPLSLSMYTNYSILNVTGSVYAIYGILNAEQSKNTAKLLSEKTYLYNKYYLQNGTLFADSE